MDVNFETNLEKVEMLSTCLYRAVCELKAVLTGRDDSVRSTKSTLMTEMVARHGIGMSKSEAARMLGVTRATIYAMLADGRLKKTPNGRRVLTESVVAYMCGITWKENDLGTEADALEEAGQS